MRMNSMRKKHLTLMVIPHNEDRVREFGLSWALIWGACAILIFCFAALIYYGVGYYVRLNREAKFATIEAENRALVEQMKMVDANLLQLRQRMNDLLSRDRQLRQMANLQPADGEAQKAVAGNGPGVGGPAPVRGVAQASYPMVQKVSLDLDHLLREADLVKGSFEEVASKLDKDIDLRNHTPSISPVRPSEAWVSSSFGSRRDPFTGEVEMHAGLDICSQIGTKVVATADGVVAERREDAYFGRHIVLNHKYGLETLYGHLQRFEVEPGQKVKRGQVIGYVGRTGRATAPHVHYGVKQGGRWINPMPYILEREELASRPAFALRDR